MLFRCILVRKLSFANVVIGAFCSPYLVVESSPLALLVCEGAEAVCAGAKLAGRLQVSELAVRNLALPTVAACWHGWVAECAMGILAVGEEFAVLLALVCNLGGWRWMTANTLAVLAGDAKTAHVVQVHGDTWRSRWRLMCELAVLVGTT